MAEIRLIDANALKETMAEFMKNNIGIYSNELFYLVDSMPTVWYEEVDYYPDGDVILNDIQEAI